MTCDIDSALSLSESCITLIAIFTQLEAVLQTFCSLTLCLQQGRGSTADSLFQQKLLSRHDVTFNRLQVSFHCCRHCIPLFFRCIPLHSAVTKIARKRPSQFPAGMSCIIPCALTWLLCTIIHSSGHVSPEPCHQFFLVHILFTSI